MAPSASNRINSMMSFAFVGRRLKRNGPGLPVTILVALLAGCVSAPIEPPAAPPERTAPAASPGALPGTAARGTTGPAMLRQRARWIGVPWTDLPGWEQDATAELWPALLRGCEKPAFDWARVCADARGAAAPALNDGAVRAWLRQRLQPWRIESHDGATEGLATGYFEPLVEATRLPTRSQKIPLYGLPGDLGRRAPYWTRQQLDTLPAARAALYGRELAHVADPLDALILQIQGSGRINLTEADGSRKLLRVAYAGHNDHPYKSVGRWLIDQGELRAEQASWPGIKAWAQRNPKRVNDLLWSNPRVVFFREEPLPDAAIGPRGAAGVPLTPGRSIAVDPLSVPYGAPVWIDTTEPLSSQPLRRLVMAQDTGSAITGAVRADYFWGWGATAEQQAGRMKQPLRMWVLWPKN